MRRDSAQAWMRILEAAVWICVLLSALPLVTGVPFAEWAAWFAVGLLVLVPVARVVTLAFTWWGRDRRYALAAAAIPIVIVIGALLVVMSASPA